MDELSAWSDATPDYSMFAAQSPKAVKGDKQHSRRRFSPKDGLANGTRRKTAVFAGEPPKLLASRATRSSQRKICSNRLLYGDNIHYAGGLPLSVWEQEQAQSPGSSAARFGRRRRKEDKFSYVLSSFDDMQIGIQGLGVSIIKNVNESLGCSKPPSPSQHDFNGSQYQRHSEPLSSSLLVPLTHNVFFGKERNLQFAAWERPFPSDVTFLTISPANLSSPPQEVKKARRATSAHMSKLSVTHTDIEEPRKELRPLSTYGRWAQACVRPITAFPRAISPCDPINCLVQEELESEGEENLSAASTPQRSGSALNSPKSVHAVAGKMDLVVRNCCLNLRAMTASQGKSTRLQPQPHASPQTELLAIPKSEGEGNHRLQMEVDLLNMMGISSPPHQRKVTLNKIVESKKQIRPATSGGSSFRSSSGFTGSNSVAVLSRLGARRRGSRGMEALAAERLSDDLMRRVTELIDLVGL